MPSVRFYEKEVENDVPVNDNLYLPVYRREDIFHAKKAAPQVGEYSGTYFYYEPDSKVFLNLGSDPLRWIIAFNKTYAALKLVMIAALQKTGTPRLPDYVSQVDKNISTPAQFMEELDRLKMVLRHDDPETPHGDLWKILDTLLKYHANVLMDKTKVYGREAYSSVRYDHQFNQLISRVGHQIGIDVIIFTNIIGSVGFQMEVVDTRHNPGEWDRYADVVLFEPTQKRIKSRIEQELELEREQFEAEVAQYQLRLKTNSRLGYDQEHIKKRLLGAEAYDRATLNEMLVGFHRQEGFGVESLNTSIKITVGLLRKLEAGGVPSPYVKGNVKDKVDVTPYFQVVPLLKEVADIRRKEGSKKLANVFWIELQVRYINVSEVWPYFAAPDLTDTIGWHSWAISKLPCTLVLLRFIDPQVVAETFKSYLLKVNLPIPSLPPVLSESRLSVRDSSESRLPAHVTFI